MSNRFQERVTTVSGGSGPTSCQPVENCPGTVLDVNVDEWGGVVVTPAAEKTDDMTPNPVVPEIGAILQAFDGAALQRMRATIDRVLLVAEEYFRRGEDYVPTSTSLVEDSLRVKGAEIPRAQHLPSQTLPIYPVYTGQPAWMVPKGVTEVVFFGTYSPSGETSFPRVKVLLGDGFDESPQLVLNTALTTVDPLARQSTYVYEIDLPQTPDFVLPVKIPRGITSVRLVASDVTGARSGGNMTVNLVAGT